MNDFSRKKPISTEPREDIVIGRNPVTELLRSDKTVDKILIAKGEMEGSITRILSLAKEKKIPVSSADRAKLTSLAGTDHHQGVLAFVTPFAYSSLKDLVPAEKKNPLILLLDGVTDPHNLGAILRTACCVGVDGVVLSKHESCGMTPVVMKTAAGATNYLKIARVTNLTDAVEELKTRSFWIYGAEGIGDKTLYETDFTGPVALVVGDEGKGISQRVRQHCDFLVRIPMNGPLNSLNVSVATGVFLYEILRQRGGA